MDLETKLEKAKGLLDRLEKINKFGNKYQVYPTIEANNVCREMNELANSISDIENPDNIHDVIQSELKRRMKGDAAFLEQNLSGRLYDFETVVNVLGIPIEDVRELEPWLKENREKTLDAVERLYHSREMEGRELKIASDIPSVRRQSKEFAGVHIRRYHQKIGQFLQEKTNVGEFLRDMTAVPTTESRSYFQPLNNTLAIGIPSICFTLEDGDLHINDRELIRLYGHEGMGHALNFVITRSNGLPHFIKKDSPLVVATSESVAQHYESLLLEDLKESKEIQKRLDIDHRFNDIYEEAKATEQLDEYKKRLFHYSISVLADKTMGNPEDPKTLMSKTELIKEVAIDPSQAAYFVQGNRHNFDSEGNLNSSLVGELRYCARPVPRALDEFSKRKIGYNGETRGYIDKVLLNGMWTPIGFVQNAKLKANNYFETLNFK